MLALIPLLAVIPMTLAQTYPRLSDRVVPYDQIPYKMDTVASGRGPQTGYNICNSTTQNQESLCQTAHVNSLEDFCLWGLPEPGQTVGDAEGEAVAYCTLPNHGTRVIPPGAISGAQFIQTDSYVQVTGYIDQTALDIAEGDYGGEMDSAGADGRGNPLGGLMYSTAFNNNGSVQQTRYWTNFMGANTFCIKVCLPGDADAPRHCEHIYDRIGCAYNVYADYASLNNTFETCQADTGLFAGVYRGSNGQLTTYTQPPESLGAISTIPYTVSVPPSSSCSSIATPPAAFLVPGRAVSSAASSAASSAVPSGSALPSGSGAASSRPVNAVSTSSARPTTTTPTSGAFPVAAFSSVMLASGLAFVALFA